MLSEATNFNVNYKPNRESRQNTKGEDLPSSHIDLSSKLTGSNVATRNIHTGDKSPLSKSGVVSFHGVKMERTSAFRTSITTADVEGIHNHSTTSTWASHIHWFALAPRSSTQIKADMENFRVILSFYWEQEFSRTYASMLLSSWKPSYPPRQKSVSSATARPAPSRAVVISSRTRHSSIFGW